MTKLILLISCIMLSFYINLSSKTIYSKYFAGDQLTTDHTYPFDLSLIRTSNSDFVDIFLWDGVNWNTLATNKKTLNRDHILIALNNFKGSNFRLKVCSSKTGEVLFISSTYFSIVRASAKTSNSFVLRDDVVLTRLFPNPSHDLLNIDYNGSYTIYDISGTKVSFGTSSGRIDISGLTPGVYFLETSNQERHKFVKQ